VDRSRLHVGGYIIEADEQAIATVSAHNEANARLIAAAPAMLEALQACTDPRAFGDLYGGHLHDVEERAMDQVRAAIAQATGGAA